ncbi:MAG: sensor domain-containing diguanylate cyclase [Lachnospiraceae bacterium]|nr:sensor domain-containing diguanylate cyclase [Lachnospiraceae bacterium]MDE6254052.1 sensor domain-containing diguanylate cyclase [Lachnospiraceae bacterium]
MDNVLDFFEIQKKFSKNNRYIADVLAVYCVLILIFGKYTNALEFVFDFFIVFLLYLDWFAGKRFYWHVKFVFRILKQAILVFSAVGMIYNSGIYLTIVIMATIYIAVFFQYLFLFDVVEDFYRLTALIETMMPLGIVTFGYYIFYGESNFEIFLVLVFLMLMCVVIMCDLNVSSSVIDKLMNDMYRQERLAINSNKEYEKLKVYQSRLVHANEQLSIQKFQMEKLNDNINNQKRQMELEYRILKHITGALELGKLMDFITSGIIENIEVDLCFILVYDTDKSEEIQKKFYSMKYSEESMLNDKTLDLFIEYAQSEEVQKNEKKYIVFNDVEEGQFEFLNNSNISSLLLYPINISSENRGILSIGKNSSGYFTENNKDFYKSIVEQIILAVNNASMYTKVQDMAAKDPLTTIYNRRHFNSIYPDFITKASKTNQPLTVILFDIDKFKNINDRFGHLFGDKVISFCGLMAGKTAKRNGGMAVRYGGEEFVVIFPNKNIDTVLRITEDMHEQIKEKEFIHEEEIVHINVSIGISSYPETCLELEELLNRADFAMYQSKNTGRGRITIDGTNDNKDTMQNGSEV